MTSSLVLFPEIRRNFVFLHSYYLSIKNLPTQLPLHGGLSRRETCSVFPPSLFTWVCDFSSLNKPSLPLLPLPFHLPLHPASEVTADPGLMLSTGSFPLPPNCTYRAAQIIWFHDQRSNSGHSYSHSATGLCKNPLGHCPYPPNPQSQHHKQPRTKDLCFWLQDDKVCSVLFSEQREVWDMPGKDSRTEPSNPGVSGSAFMSQFLHRERL